MKYASLLVLCLMAQIWGYSEVSRDFKEQDRIFKNCQKVFDADKYEQQLLEEAQKETAEKYLSKRELAKRKPHVKEKSNQFVRSS